jgi:hypothetical protein
MNFLYVGGKLSGKAGMQEAERFFQGGKQLKILKRLRMSRGNYIALKNVDTYLNFLQVMRIP